MKLKDFEDSDGQQCKGYFTLKASFGRMMACHVGLHLQVQVELRVDEQINYKVNIINNKYLRNLYKQICIQTAQKSSENDN